MKLLLDQNLSHKLIGVLLPLFDEVSHVRVVGLSEAEDQEIWMFAKLAEYDIVTMDGDFAELAALRGHPPKVVWLRCGNQPTHVIASKLRASVDEILEFSRSSNSVFEIY